MSYQNGKIYKIVSEQTDKVYIGSTIDPLTTRLTCHKSGYKRWKNEKRGFTASFDIVKYGDAKIMLLESYPCRNKDELREQEQVWLDKTPNYVNQQKAHSRNKIVLVDNYQIGRVYKIVSKNTDRVYIGSTELDLHTRFACHKADYNLWLVNRCAYVSSFNILSKGDYDIVLLETVMFKQKVELRMREQDWLD